MRRATKGLTLIEILLATAILAAVLIPTATFIIGGMRRTEQSKHSNIAMAIASNIFDELLGPGVPFACIDPTGASSDAGFAGSTLVTALPACGKHVQATFKKVSGGPNPATLEAYVSDKVKNKSRIKVSPEGLEFEVFFFAGTYADTAASGGKADLNNELTFAYIPNPYVVPDNVAASQRVLGLPAAPALLHPMDKLFPYTAQPQPRNPSSTPVSIKDWYYGWPQPGNGYRPGAQGLKDDVKKAFNDFAGGPTAQNPKYFAVFQDQADFGRPKGGLMKLVLGIRWNPNTHVGLGVGYTKNSRELWLETFKADLAQH